MIQAKQALLAALAEAIAEVAPGATLAAAFESPRQAAHGDLACTAAMPLAKALKTNPRAVAFALVEALNRQPAVQRWVDALEIAGPGFINLRLKAAARQAVVAEVLKAGEAFGRAHARNAQDRKPAEGQPSEASAREGEAEDGVAGGHDLAEHDLAEQAAPKQEVAGQADRMLVEFVSANPTGPLHVGHARQAALGDAICNLFETQGWQVTREFYYNDAGVQIATLAASVQARLNGFKPGDAEWPAAAYNGDYIADIAADFLAGKTVVADDRSFTASGDAADLDGIRQFAVAYLRHEQDLDLQAFGVHFDHYFLESSLYASGRVDATVQRLIAAGKTFEEGGALWLRTTEYGDDKDRVMRKSAPAGSDAATAEATYTYFVPDVAYHLNKFERGFGKAINIQGGDHHGTIARVRAGLQAANMGVPPDYPDYVLHKMVTVMKGGEEVKISKRAGSYVTLRDLIDWTSRDAVRFFLLSRKADSEFTFDVDLALKRNDENPVFYVQYAHARICSVIRQFAQQHGGIDDREVLEVLSNADLGLLTAPAETALMLKLAEFPAVLANAAASLAPHDLTFYLRDVAGAFHSYYAAERFLVDDDRLAAARLALLMATRQVIRNALAVLGVSAPERMDREVESADTTQASKQPELS